MLKKLIIFLVIFVSPYTFAAKIDYQATINELNTRLDMTLQLYLEGKTLDAKTTVQMAYFELFENIEGPIRINFSQKRSYEFEAQFGEIRKMIVSNQSIQTVTTKINLLKSELSLLPEQLDAGHQLVAQTRNDSGKKVLPYWKIHLQIIDNSLADAIYNYRTGNQKQAVLDIQNAQFSGYKNSDLETAIRLHISSKKSAAYNQNFTKLLTLAKQPDQLVALGYETTRLIQDLSDDIPGLPATRSSQVKIDAAEPQKEIPVKEWNKIAIAINTSIQHAIELYQSGKTKQAMMAIQNTYFDQFEASGMESAVGARDVTLKSKLEGYFTRMVSMIKAKSASSDISNQASLLSEDLNKAVSMISQQGQGFWAMLLASFTIIFREGMEALLIVAAIVSFLVKNNHEDKLPVIKNSVIVGLVASIVTAALFHWIFENAGANREMLEGITMLIAVVVLFSMSYWLLAKVDAHKWKAYLQSTISQSLTKGSLYGLWFASFLAIYREGAETVLFYYALGVGASTHILMAIISGFIIGIITLIAVYFIMRYTVVKLPLRPFFMFTGSFMYLMAFVFSGNGVLELIEGKLFEPTLLPFVPEINILGIHPYLETLAPQVLLIIAAFISFWVMRYRSNQDAILENVKSTINEEKNYVK